MGVFGLGWRFRAILVPVGVRGVVVGLAVLGVGLFVVGWLAGEVLLWGCLSGGFPGYFRFVGLYNIRLLGLTFGGCFGYLVVLGFRWFWVSLSG